MFPGRYHTGVVIARGCQRLPLPEIAAGLFLVLAGCSGADGSGTTLTDSSGSTEAGSLSSGNSSSGPSTSDDGGTSATSSGAGMTETSETGSTTGGEDAERRELLLVGGLDHFCRLVPLTGAVLCWGSNDHGQLGVDGVDAASTEDPAEVAGLPETPVRLFPGAFATCGQMADGTVWCWGDGGAPAEAPDLKLAIHVDLGRNFGCQIDADGKMLCWGSDRSGQIGDGAPHGEGTVVDVPTTPLGLEGGVRHFTTATHQYAWGYACGIDTHGGTYCWGTNDLAALGQGKGGPPEPAPLSLVVPAAIDLSSVHDRTCALTETEEVWCWGGLQDLVNGGLRKGTERPVQVPLDRPHPVQVATGGAEACALFEDGAVGCWWGSDDGQYVEPFTAGAVSVAGSVFEACALLEDDTVACWEYTDPNTLETQPAP